MTGERSKRNNIFSNIEVRKTTLDLFAHKGGRERSAINDRQGSGWKRKVGH